MRTSLQDRPIIVTGASSGIGAATAIACGKEKMQVLLVARRTSRLNEVAATIVADGGVAEVLTIDICAPDATEAILNTCEDCFGAIDVVVANAGRGLDQTALDMTMSDLRSIFDVNFFACAQLLIAAGQRLVAANAPGHLLACSSSIGTFAVPNHSAYCATKAAQHLLTQAMCMELAPANISVSSVHPIGTRTEFFDVSAATSGRDPDAPTMLDTTPSFFLQDPDRIATAIVRCLKRPRPEVWTCFSVRVLAALCRVAPRTGQSLIRRFG
jgi:short-subunit dehydrogenase